MKRINFFSMVLLLSMTLMSLTTKTYGQTWNAQQKEVWSNVETYWAVQAKGDVDGFIENSRTALSVDPTKIYIQFNLGLGLLLKGEYEKAAIAYRGAANKCTTPKEIERDGIQDILDAISSGLKLDRSEDILNLLRSRILELK